MKRLLTIMCVVLVASGAVYAKAKDKLLVVDIRVEGLQKVKLSDVKSRFTLRKKHAFSQELLDSDTKAIVDSGLFDDVQTEMTENAEGVVITYIVKERPRVVKISFQGNQHYKASKIDDVLKMKEKEAFDSTKVSIDEDAIKNFYREEGYADVQVTSYPDIDTAKNEVKLTFYITEGNKVMVHSITFAGNTVISSKKLRKLMKTRSDKVFKEDPYQNDLRAIEVWYKNKGYLKVAVQESPRVLDSAKQNIDLTITITEGMQYRVGAVTFTGNSEFSTEHLRKKITFKSKSIYNEEQFEKTIQHIHSLYADKGYIRADIEPRYTYNEKDNVVDIEFDIKENGIVYINRIYIEGNDVTRRYVIERQLVVKEGDPLSVSKVRRSQERIYNLGFFQDVQIDMRQIGEDQADLTFSVIEQKTGLITMGAGYSSQDGPIGSIQVSETNLFGKGQKLSLMWEFGKRRENYQISFQDPFFFMSNTSFACSIFNMLRQQEFVYVDDNRYTKSDWYYEHHEGGNITFGRRYAEIYTVNATYGFERVRVYDVDDVTSTNHQPLLDDQKEGEQTTSSVGFSFFRDTRDNVFDPSEGAYTTLSTKFAGGLFGGNRNFTKYQVGHSWFIPTFWKLVLGFNVNGGVVTAFPPSKSVPIYETFYVGGAESVRGYDYRGEIGPGGGGNYKIVYNVEYKFPIVQEMNHTVLQGAFFCDVGGAWNDQNRVTLEIGRGQYQMKSGVGFGIRFKTPVFPIRLDWGYGLNKAPGKTPDQFYFTIGSIF